MEFTPVKLNLEGEIFDDEQMYVEHFGVVSYDVDKEIQEDIENLLS